MGTFYATAGDDKFVGTENTDDTVSYDSSTSGITVDLTYAGPQETGGSGYDELIYIDSIVGSDFDDEIMGTGGFGTLYGGDGNDQIKAVLSSSGASSTMVGGSGFDTLIIDASDLLAARFSGGFGSGLLYDSYFGTAVSISSFERLNFKGSANGSYYGSVSGGDGDDILIGLEGDDIFDAGKGNNVVDGGAGSDSVRLDFSDRTGSLELVYYGGTDAIYVPTVGGVAAGSIANVEILNIVGGTADDRIGGFVVTTGRTSTLDGGTGTDTLVVDASNLTGTRFSGGLSSGILYDSYFGTAISISRFEKLEFTGDASGGYYGAVSGGDGDDILIGLGGNDAFNAGKGNNIVDGGAGTDSVTLDFSDRRDDLIFFNGGVNGTTYAATVGGAYAGSVKNIEVQNVTGGAGNDRIGARLTVVGMNSNLDGGAGTDTLVLDTSGLGSDVRFSGSLVQGFFYDSYYGTSVSASRFERLEFIGNANGSYYGQVSGGDGDDILIGLDQDDGFAGGKGNNIIDGGAGRDTASLDYSDRTGNLVLVNGGIAGTTYTATVDGVAAGSITNIEILNVTGGVGNDRIGATLRTVGVSSTMAGGSGTDTLVIDASLLDGNVRFSGGIDSGGLYDSYYGTNITASGFERLEFTGNANGSYYGRLSGGDGDDILTGLDQDDSFAGGKGDDRIYGGRGNDRLDGGTGNNIIDGGEGSDTATLDYSDRTGDLVLLNGGVEGRVYTATVGGKAAGSIANVEILNATGGSGNDRIGAVLRTVSSSATMDGGSGIDTLVIDASGLDNIVRFSGGLPFGGFYDSYYGTSITASRFERLEFTGNANGNYYGEISGGDGNDILIGLDQDDSFAGGKGDDYLAGGKGNDRLNGGTGDNIVDGGEGVDTATLDYSDRAADLILVNGGTAGIVYTASVGGTGAGSVTNIEVLNATGGSGNDRIGAVLRAVGTSSTLDGGAGLDTLVIDASALDSNVRFSGGLSFGGLYDNYYGTSITASRFERLEFTGNANGYYYGQISGGEGDDILVGLDQDDSFAGGSGNDRIVGGKGNDSLDGGTGDDRLTGGDGADYIDGEAGDDVFDDVGKDASVDWLTGGSGRDLYILDWVSNSAVDVVTDFQGGSGGDRIDFSSLLPLWTNYSGANPLASGHLSLVQSGNDVLVQMDRDGQATSGFSPVTILRLANQRVEDLGGENFSLSLAQAQLDTSAIDFGIHHVGDVVPGRNIGLTNSGASEALTASLSSNNAGIIVSGEIIGLAPGQTDNRSLSAKLDTGFSGSRNGSLALTLSSQHTADGNIYDTPLSSLSILAQGAVFAYADPLAAVSADSFRARVGSAGSGTLTLQNGQFFDAYQEALHYHVEAEGLSTTGSSGIIGSGATTAIGINFDTSTVGAYSGTVTLHLSSDGEGGSGLGVTALTDRIFDLNIAVYRLAETAGTNLRRLDLGAVHEGTVTTAALTIRNDASTDGYSETLNAIALGTDGTGISAGGGFTGLHAGQTDSQSLTVSISGGQAGQQSGSATFAFLSDGAGTSGVSATEILRQTIDLSATVYRLAAVSLEADVLDFGNVRVGATAHDTIDVSNIASDDGFSEKLDLHLAWMSGAATADGDVDNLVAGATAQDAITIGVDTSAAGYRSGVAVFASVSDGEGTSGLGLTGVEYRSIAVSGKVFRVAEAQIFTPTSQIYHVGDVIDERLSISNIASADGYSEKLKVSVQASAGDMNGSGNIDGLLAGEADSQNVRYTIDTGSAGYKSGTILLDLASDGSGTSELGTIGVGTRAVEINTTVNQYANLGLTSSLGTLVRSGNEFILDLGRFQQDDPALHFSIGILNDVTGYADVLSGSLHQLTNDGFVNDGALAFDKLSSGALQNVGVISLDKSNAGEFTQSFLITSEGSNASGYAAALADHVLTIKATIFASPSPDLRVASVEAGPEALAGTTVPISWTITNSGNAAAAGPWIDIVYASSNAQGDNPVEIGRFEFDAMLVPGESVTRTQVVTLPEALSGNQWLVVRTDAGNSVTEHGCETNNDGQTASPVNIAPAIHADLVVTDIAEPAAAFSEAPVEVSWTVKNNGTASTSAPFWYDNVYLSLDDKLDALDVLVGSVANPGFLPIGASYTSHLAFRMPQGISGPYHILVSTDGSNSVAEGQKEQNNFLSSAPFNVQLSPSPDLRVNAVTAPLQAFSGQKMTVGYTVINAGQAATATDKWADRVVMSADDVLDANDRTVATVAHDGPLAPDGSYNGSASFTLPTGITGNYRFFVVTDSGNAIYEHATEGNNIGQASRATLVNLTPPPDLEANFVALPSSGVANHNISLSYSVLNAGATITPETYWYDQLFLSNDTILDTGDITIGGAAHYGALQAGDSYEQLLTVLLPDRLQGRYYVLLKSDAANAVFELDKANNLTPPASIDIAYTPANLTIGTVNAPTAGINGRQITVNWTVANTGSGDTVASNWADAVYLTALDGAGSSDIRLATAVHKGALNAGGAYTASATFILPEAAVGDYRLTVRTNDSGSVPEAITTDNEAYTTLHIDRRVSDLRTAAVNTVDAAVAGGNIAVSWTVSNNSVYAANTSFWYDNIYLSMTPDLSGTHELLTSVRRVNGLAAGANYTASANVSIPASWSGEGYIVVVSDGTALVTEIDETNNLATSGSIHIDPLPPGQPLPAAPHPDLFVKQVSADATAVSNEGLTVRWLQGNEGDGAPIDQAYDRVYLSRDTILDRKTDILLGAVAHSGALSAGTPVEAHFTIPTGLSGPFWAIVVADPDNRSGDVDRSDNVAISTRVDVSLQSPADLQVTDSFIKFPPNISDVGTISITSLPGSSGSALVYAYLDLLYRSKLPPEIFYTVSNASDTAATGGWEDAIYISKDQSWDFGDKLVGYRSHNNLGAHDSYTDSFFLDLNNVEVSDQYVIIRTDARNTQTESSESNNILSSNIVIPIRVPELHFGEASTGELSQGGSALFQFTVGAGETVRVRADSDQDFSVNNIYIRQGEVPTFGQFDAMSKDPTVADPTAIVEITKPGTYYVKLFGDNVSGTEHYSIIAEKIGYSITGITPDHASNLGSVTLTVSGAKFQGDELVSIAAPDGSQLAASKLLYVNGSTLWATFDLRGQVVGAYDVRISHGTAGSSTQASAQLNDAFTVDSSPVGAMSVNLIAPATLRPGQGGIIRVEYANIGNTDITAPLLDLETVNSLLQSRGMGNATTEISFVGLASQGPQGIIQPGQHETAIFTFQPTIGSGTITFDLHALSGSDTAIDFALLRNDLKPVSIDTKDWNHIFDQFLVNIGGTENSMLKALSENATQLAQIGQANASLGTLLKFEIAQATGSFVKTVFTATTDLALSGVGPDSAVTRLFTGSLLGRNAEGSFGTGWTMTFDARAINDADGSVLIRTAGGSESFIRAANGRFVAAAGSTDTLTVENGRYVVTSLDKTVLLFNADGSLGALTDANGNAVVADWSNGRLTALTQSDGQGISFTYNEFGRIATATDGKGNLVSYIYDATGAHLIQVERPDGVTRYEYNQADGSINENALTAITYADGTHRYFTYDSAGRLASEEGDAGAGHVAYSYDSAGGVIARDAQGNSTSLIFDARGNLAQVQDAQGNVGQLGFDSLGLLTGSSGSSGVNSGFTYDILGNLTGITDPLGNNVTLAYQPGTSNLTQVTDQAGRAMHYDYDAAGNLTGITYADGTGTQYSYDSRGLVTGTTNARGDHIAYGYDGSGNLTSKIYGDGSHADYSYDSRGNLTSATTREGGTTSYTYDSADRLLSQTDAQGRTISFAYDEVGRRIERLDPDGSETHYSYDSAGRLSALHDGAGSLVIAYSYDELSRLSHVDKGNGTVTNYAYDSAGRVTAIIDKGVDGSVIGQSLYTYDASSRPATMTTLDGSWTYGYDAAGQLTHAAFASINPDISSSDTSYVYDAAGNRVETIDADGTHHAYTSNALNQYVTADGWSLSYDADGNMTGKSRTGDSWTYVYDSENRLNAVTHGAETWAYGYDAVGNRVWSEHDGVRDEYVIDPFAMSAAGGLASIAQTYNASGSLQDDYDYGLRLAANMSAEGSRWFGVDLIGNVTTSSDVQGGSISQFAYNPFGEILNGVSEDIDFLHSGAFGVTTDSTGLEYMRSRYYSPEYSRFLSRDLINITDNLNLYSYVAQQPTVAADPTGEWLFLILPVVGGLVGGTANALRGGSFWQGALFGAAAGAGGLIAGMAIAEAGLALGASQAVAGGIGAVGGSGFGAGLENAYNQLANKDIPNFSWGDVGTAAAIGAAVGPIAGKIAGKIGPIAFKPGTFEPQIFKLRGLDEFGTNTIKKIFQEPFASGIGENLKDLVDLGRLLGPGFLDDLASALTAVIPIIRASDPNDIVGPKGFGDEHFITRAETQSYTINFENMATATAPAQHVEITQKLDADLDPRSFRLTGFGFEGQTYALTGTQAFYQTRIDLSATKGYLVDVTATVDVAKGELHWTFDTIDPATGAPVTAADVGFLPINDDTHRGEGFVSYIVKSKTGIETGTIIDSQATIIFDDNEPIDTPAIMNTIDAAGPIAHIEAVTTTQDSKLLVSWSGQDEDNGSGVADYSIYVSTDGGPATSWLSHTTLHEAEFTPEAGHDYVFLITARDNAGNEAALAQAPVANTPPTGEPTVTLPHGTEDTPYIVHLADLIAGIADANGDTLSVTNLSVSNAIISDNHDGSWTIVTPADFNGTLTLNYVVEDGRGGALPAALEFVVDDVPEDRYLTGGDDANILEGGDGNDRIDGGGGNDSLFGWKGNDTLFGSDGDDSIGGQEGNDRLFGGAGSDVISGGIGDDLLDGGAGQDTLIGGTGADIFRFSSNEGPQDRIKGYEENIDRIEISVSAFSALTAYGLGQLDPGELSYGVKATQAGQHLIYNQAKGHLLYDADGMGGQDAVIIAAFTNKPSLEVDDIFLV